MILVSGPFKGLWLTALMFLIGASIAESACPKGWLPIYPTSAGTGTAQCFKLFGKSSKTFGGAQAYCRSLGGYLATDTTSNIHRKLSSYIIEAGKASNKPYSFWIGLTAGKSLPWKWTSGAQYGAFKAWYKSKEPARSTIYQSCGYIITRSSKAGKWFSTINCDVNRAVVCQHAPNSGSAVTTPPRKFKHCKGYGDNQQVASAVWHPVVSCAKIKCPKGWTAYTARSLCIYLSGNKYPYASARSYCKNQGGDLIKIIDSEMNAYVNSLISRKKATYLIGLTDKTKEKTFVWNDEKNKATFTNWDKGEPNNYDKGEDCGSIVSRNYKWNDVPCNIYLNFICQRKPIKVPTPRMKTASTSPTPSKNCGIGWEEDKTSVYCYQFHRDLLSWRSADTVCKTNGGHLASIHSPEQQFYLTGKLRSYDNNFLWIGANDQASEGGWKWSDNTPFAYMNWDVRQPDNKWAQDCAGMVPSTGKWNDLVCTLKYGYICQKIGKRKLPTLPPPTPPRKLPHGKIWGCPTKWIQYSGFCYYFFNFTSGVTWDFANTFCRSQQRAELISIKDKLENDFVFANIPKDNFYDMWIGFNDKAKENTFVWSDNTPVTWTYWARNEPNNHQNEDCGVMYTGRYQTGRWNDDDCSDSNSRQKVVGCKKRTAIVSATTNPLKSGCQKGTYGFLNKCYAFTEIPTTFAAAETSCTRNHGHLATVDNNYVEAFLTPIVSKGKGSAYWIGLSSRAATKKEYRWSSGSKLHYTNWARSHTGKETNNCVSMQVANPSGLWTDHDCNSIKLPYVCEYARVGYTAPPTYTTVTSKIPCPTGWYTKGGMCYRAFGSSSPADLMSWRAARDKCESFATGGTLATISSNALSYWLYTQVVSAKIDRSRPFWIGLNDLTLEAGYEWTDHSPMSWARWNSGEPNNSGNKEDCVTWDLSQGYGKWNDAYCAIVKNYICQFPKGSALNTPPPTVSLGPTAGYCGDSSWTYDSSLRSCYYISPASGDNARVSWFEARKLCHNMGAELTSIGKGEENEVIATLVSRLNKDAWIGMNDIDSPSHRWVDNTPATYWSWNTHEPNDHDGLERCVEITSFGMWNDDNCNKNQAYVCKRRPGNYHYTISPTQLPTGGCADDFVTHELASHCYSVYQGGKVKANFDHAQKACKDLQSGGTLATIRNSFENQFILLLLKDVKSPAWIGFLKPSRVFNWVDNTPINYVNWGRKNYISSKAGAVILNGAKEMGKWASVGAYTSYPYVCQSPKKSFISPPGPDVTGCNRGYQRFGNSCYKVYGSVQYIWTDAEQLCVEEKGHLISITDSYEAAFFYVLTSELQTQMWIGLQYDPISALYKWSDGWPVTFAQWGPDQPIQADGGGCVSSNRSTVWEDYSCLQTLPFVCEVNLGTPPVPTTSGRGTCPKGWTSSGRNCYYVESTVSNSRAWAKTACKSKGGMLASILSKAEEVVIEKLISKISTGLWIGLTPGGKLSGYKWDDGSVVDYINIVTHNDINEGREEECVQISSYTSTTRWYKADCSSRFGYICKMAQKTSTIVMSTLSTPKPSTSKSRTHKQVIKTLPTTTKKMVTNPRIVTQKRPTAPPRQPATGTKPAKPGRQTPAAQSSSSSNELSGGSVAGIIIGVMAVVIIALLIVVLVRRGHADSLLKRLKSSPALDEPGSKGFDNVLYSTSGQVTMHGSMQSSSNT